MCLRACNGARSPPARSSSWRRWICSRLGYLVDRLSIEIDHEHWLDAFLLAAGASQVIDDSFGAPVRRYGWAHAFSRPAAGRQ